MSAHGDPVPELPVDPDVTDDADVPPPQLHRGAVAAIALGGALGSVGRWGVSEVLPHAAGRFPWDTLLTNAAGCLLIGVLMVLVAERWRHRPLVRPFLGTGILGGFTTFSTYLVDTRTVAVHGHPLEAVLYLVGSLAVGLLAVVAGLSVTQRVVA